MARLDCSFLGRPLEKLGKNLALVAKEKKDIEIPRLTNV
jgi:hypothetical protein